MSALIDRRIALGGLAAAAATVAVSRITARAASALADPVFAAIERHKAALTRLEVACLLTDCVLAKLQEREITVADEAEDRAASEDEAVAFFAVISTAPQTRAGARALIEYVGTLDDLTGVEEALPTFLATLLRSSLIAGEV